MSLKVFSSSLSLFVICPVTAVAYCCQTVLGNLVAQGVA
jgi:hypothetical protein